MDSQSLMSHDQLYHYLLDRRLSLSLIPSEGWMQNGGEQAKTQEEVGEEQYPTFTNQLKWTLIIDQLVKDNNVEGKPEDIRAFAKQQLFSYMGGMGGAMDTDQPWVNDYVEKMMHDKKFVQDSFHRITYLTKYLIPQLLF